MDFSFRYDVDAPAGTYRLDNDCPPYFTGPDKLTWSLPTAAGWEGPAAARVALNGMLEAAAIDHATRSQQVAPREQIDDFLRHAKAAKVATGALAKVEFASMRPAARGVPYRLDDVVGDRRAMEEAMNAHNNAVLLHAEIIELSARLHRCITQFEGAATFYPAEQVRKVDLAIRSLLRAGVMQNFPFWAYRNCPLVKAVAALFVDAHWEEPDDLPGKVWTALRNHHLNKGRKRPLGF